MTERQPIPPKDDPRWELFRDWLSDLVYLRPVGPCPLCGYTHAEHCDDHQFCGCPPFRERQP